MRTSAESLAELLSPRTLLPRSQKTASVLAVSDMRNSSGSLDMDEIIMGNGQQRRAIGRTTKVRFVDKLVAIDRAMRHLGLFERDIRQMQRNLTIQVGLVFPPPRSDEE